MKEHAAAPAAEAAKTAHGAPSDDGLAEPDDDSGVTTEDPAERLAAAAGACTGVCALTAGSFGEAGTYLPGRRVDGVVMTDTAVEIHVVARWDVPAPVVAAEIRAACLPLAEGRKVDVVIEDIDTPSPETSREPARDTRRAADRAKSVHPDPPSGSRR